MRAAGERCCSARTDATAATFWSKSCAVAGVLSIVEGIARKRRSREPSFLRRSAAAAALRDRAAPARCAIARRRCSRCSLASRTRLEPQCRGPGPERRSKPEPPATRRNDVRDFTARRNRRGVGALRRSEIVFSHADADNAWALQVVRRSRDLSVRDQRRVAYGIGRCFVPLVGAQAHRRRPRYAPDRRDAFSTRSRAARPKPAPT